MALDAALELSAVPLAEPDGPASRGRAGAPARSVMDDDVLHVVYAGGVGTALLIADDAPDRLDAVPLAELPVTGRVVGRCSCVVNVTVAEPDQ